MQLKRAGVMLLLVLGGLVLIAALLPSIIEGVLRLSGVPLHGLQTNFRDHVQFDRYEDQNAARRVRIQNFELKFRREAEGVVVEKLLIGEIFFEDLARPVVALRTELDRISDASPTSKDTLAIRELRIGKLSLTPSASSTPIELSEVTVRDLTIDSEGAHIGSISLQSPLIQMIDEGETLRGTIDFSPTVFSDLRRDWRWSFSIPKSRLALSPQELERLKKEAATYSQP